MALKSSQLLIYLRNQHKKLKLDDLILKYYKATSFELDTTQETLLIYLDYIQLLAQKESFEEIECIYKYKLRPFFYKFVFFWTNYLEYLNDSTKIESEKLFLENKSFSTKERILELINEKLKSKSNLCNESRESIEHQVLDFQSSSTRKCVYMDLPSPLDNSFFKLESKVPKDTILKQINTHVNNLNISPKKRILFGESTNRIRNKFSSSSGQIKPTKGNESSLENTISKSQSIENTPKNIENTPKNIFNPINSKISFGDTENLELLEPLTFKGIKLQRLFLLGKGGSCKVYATLFRGVLRAIKEVIKDLERAKSEIDILLNLQMEGAIRLFDYEITPSKILLILEYGDIDLHGLIREKLSFLQIEFLWSEILNIVVNLHSKKIIHKDLKPSNFLLVKGRIKVIDFGISIRSNETAVINLECIGTINYMAPETVKCSGTSGKRSDVWSLGCILYEMYKLKPPFVNTDIRKQILQLMPNYEIDYSGIPEGAKAVIQSCLTREYEKRPSAEALLEFKLLNK